MGFVMVDDVHCRDMLVCCKSNNLSLNGMVAGDEGLLDIVIPEEFGGSQD